MRVVLDTNILLISIPKNSRFRLIFDSFINRQFSLVVSNDILSEYAEVIASKTNSIVSANILEMLLAAKNVEKQEIYYKWHLITADNDDNKFVDCVIAGNVDYLVTNDKHFNKLKSIEFPPITVLNINEFIELLTKK